MGCAEAIFCARSEIEGIIRDGYTASLCALDISRAFPSVVHHRLFLELMRRGVPKAFLELVEYWYSRCISCVAWNGILSVSFPLEVGIMQGSCLAPPLFGLFIDSLVDGSNLVLDGHGIILVYADDILIICREVDRLQLVVDSINAKLDNLILKLNVIKCVCMRIGPRFRYKCADIVCADGQAMAWVQKLRYLGVWFLAGMGVNFAFDQAKSKFNRAVNAIFGKISNLNYVDLLVHLIKVQCLPILIYGSEAMLLKTRDIKSLDFTFKRFFFKLFATGSISLVDECMERFYVTCPSVIIARRQGKFYNKLLSCNSNLISRFL